MFKKKGLQQAQNGSEILLLSLYYAEQEIVQEETTRGGNSNKEKQWMLSCFVISIKTFIETNPGQVCFWGLNFV